MKKISLIFLVTLSLFFAACDSKTEATLVEDKSSNNVQTATQLPKFILTTTKGEKINLEISNQTMFSKELNGKIVLINFWAPWCAPCEKEMPSFVKLQEKYKNDFVILGVLFDKKSTPKQVEEFLKKYKVNFPITVGEENFKLAKVYNDIKMIPESFLYSKDGIFIKKFVGEISEQKLENYIKDNIN